MIIGIKGKSNMCAACNFCPIFVPKFIEYMPSRIRWDVIKDADSLDNVVAVPEVRVETDVMDSSAEVFFVTEPWVELLRIVWPGCC